MKDYIVVDIESPNMDSYSVSAIGIVIVKNNEKVDTVYSLINPEDYFDEEIIEMTGITPVMVKNAPKFYEFWPKIEKLLTENPIVGHNVTYDLSVISTTLERYHIKVQKFEYFCTMKLSKKRMTLDSYALTYIMSQLNFEYNAHNALADAEATFYLFQHLNDIREINIIEQNTFIHRGSAKKEINEEIIPNINELYGYIIELRYKDEINEKHINLITNWINENEENRIYLDINKIISKLEYLLQEDINSKDFTKKLSKVTTFASKTNIYSKEELNLQVLNGILGMIRTDKTINRKEYNFLEKWLNYYELPKEINPEKILSSFEVK